MPVIEHLTSRDRHRSPAATAGRADAASGSTTQWHAVPADSALTDLGVDRAGLTHREVADRRARHGRNELPLTGATPLWRIVVRQFASPLIYVLVAAAVVSLLIGERTDATFIALVLAINAGIGAWQEAAAERSAGALQDLVRTTVTVRRDGRPADVAADELVPGDVVLVSSGQRVSADVRLLDASALRVDEAALTGESNQAEKRADAVVDADAALGDRSTMLFAGTTVVSGRGEGVVTATGGRTELGRIAVAARGQRAGEAPLVVRMERFTRQIALVTLFGAALYAAVSLAQGAALVQVFFLAVALVVSAIPEGLPVAMTSTLAIGATRMGRRGVIVRGANAVEALGSATVIASDKTGTLTANRQAVRLIALPPSATPTVDGEDVWHRYAVSGRGDAGSGDVTVETPRSDPPRAAAQPGTTGTPGPADGPSTRARVRALAVAAAVANEATLTCDDGDWSSTGDAVDVALLALAHKAGVDPARVRQETRQLAAVPYESERAFSAAIVAANAAALDTTTDGAFVAVKGAVETVLRFTRHAAGPLPTSATTAGDTDGRHGPLPALAAQLRARRELDPDVVRTQADRLAAEGYRVIAVAAGHIAPGAEVPDDDALARRAASGARGDLTLLGLVGMIDPLRPGAREAVRSARRAGVRVAMVTGDHPATAAAIGRDLGLLGRAPGNAAQDGALVSDGATAPDRPDADADGTDDTTDAVVTGADLAAIVAPDDDPDGNLAAADPRFVETVTRGRVFARVAPLQKLQIVRALQADRQFAAVTGDGVNDAPALRTANIGVAMGSGTDAAKDVADMIVTDDDFASIVTGIEQGRHAYANVRKVIWALVAAGVAELALFLLALLAGLPAPLVAVQLLWLNVVTNGIQGVALAFEGGEPGVMDRPPREPDEPIFDRAMITQTLLAGAVMTAGAFGVWWWALGPAGLDTAAARNLVLLVMVLFENVHTLNARSETASALTVPLRRNRMLIAGILGAFGLHVAALHTPALQAVLGTAPVPGPTFAALVVVALTLLLAVEALKAWRRAATRATSATVTAPRGA